MKRVYLFTILCLFVLFLSGCGTNTPKNKVENYLSRYTLLNDDVNVDIETSIVSSNLSESNKDKYRKVLERQYKNMTYTVKDETINGDEATVNVRIKVYDYYKSDLDSKEYLSNNKDKFYNNNILDEDLYDSYRLDNMLKMNDTVEYDITFYLNKSNGTWIVSNPDETTLLKIHGLYNY